MKNAILVVSFGSTHQDTLEHAIEPTEARIAQAFPQAQIYRAFTSPTVRRRLEAKGIHVDSVEEALQKIASDGFKQVVIQPTLLIPGHEFDRLSTIVNTCTFPLTCRMGTPLIRNEEDLDTLLSLLPRFYPVEKDEILLLMGHGTDHEANHFYVNLAQKMASASDSAMALTTVEGKPDFQDTIKQLKALPVRKVTAAPLMMVAGDHAKNDMSGPDPDSLRSLLEQAGFEVTCQIKGLGEFEEIREIYVERLKALMV